ncbi:MAG: tyrosine--tRNA ligase [Candidatus Shapirobacteria bacterium]|nr:tyrosine--tRNA ligase [Candidatus Shapirobacteria bacterium]
MSDNEKIEEILSRGVVKIYPSKEALEKVLRSGKRIRLYLGIDPSNPQLHLGHTVVLKKLREFQNLGHEVILLVGDFTGRIGDPTDKTSMRKKLTHKEVLENAKTYQNQAEKVVKFDGKNPVKLKFNSEWLDKLTFNEIAELATFFTVQQFLERDMYQKRIKEGKPIGLHEFLYPLMQAYDSVAMDVNMEIGGNDQTFNMLVGRELVKSKLGREKFVITVPLLLGTDGQKMGKSLGNYIPLTDSANDIYGKIMSLHDDLVYQYFELCTLFPLQSIKSLEKELNPMDLKKRLAFEIVKMYHSEKEAQKAQKEFEKVFQNKGLPSNMETISCSSKNQNIIDLLVKNNLVSSRSEAKRLIEQGSVDIDEQTIKDFQNPINVKNGSVIHIGKRKFAKINLIG